MVKETPETDVKGQEPRIGVFVCDCGINIKGTVDVPSVVEYAKTLPNVVYAEENKYTCSADSQESIKKTDQGAQAEPRRRRVLHAPYPRGAVPEHHQGSRA